MQKTTTRAYHFKSRNGCLRCKAKKTKCDEKKPACARCEERNLSCPGYALNVRWSQKHQVRGARRPSPKGCNPSSSSTSSMSPPTAMTPSPLQSNTAGDATSVIVAHAAADVAQRANQPGGVGQGAPRPLPSSPWLTAAASPQWGDFFMPHELPCPDNSANALLTPDASQHPHPHVPPDLQDQMAPAVSAPVASWGGEDFMDDATWAAESAGQVQDVFARGTAVDHFQIVRTDSPSRTLAQAEYSARQPFNHPPLELFNLPTALSEYFFRHVITLYCAWDSESNVMRNIVEASWNSSGALHHTIQSMAAACLSEDFPHLLAVAKKEHYEALQMMHAWDAAAPSSTGAHKRAKLLASTLLGHTSSWLMPQNLATDRFRASCSMLKEIAAETGGVSNSHGSSYNDPCLSFFSDTMDYWAMLLVYLTDSQDLGDYPRSRCDGTEGTSSTGPTGPSRPVAPIDPHPYSGISHQMVRVLTDTGILVFRYRKHMSSVKFMTEEDLDVFRSALREARRLERALLAHRTPDLSHVRDVGDPRTPLRHLELIDEAYRCTGLLQIYRVFPDLLNERYAPWERDQLLCPVPAESTPTADERQAWLTKLAIHTLDILREIPFESRTRSAQPFIMVAASSELRRHVPGRRPLGTQRCVIHRRWSAGSEATPGPERNGEHHLTQMDNGGDDDNGNSSSQDDDPAMYFDLASVEVVQARNFVGSRLAAYTHILPLRKSRVIFELINTVWEELDEGQQDVYWLDVARQKNLATMMG